MSTVITAGNATNGLSLSADNTGTFEFKTGTGAGTTALSIDASQNVTFTKSIIRSGNVVASTSGTSIDFTSIPSGVKRITVMFSGVSTSGISNIIFQIGTSGGIQTTGYAGAGTILTTSSSVFAASFTTGFGYRTENATATYSGATQITLCDSTNGIWVASGTLGSTTLVSGYTTGGTKTLSGTLDRVRITTVNGTDTFDAGSINILYE
jgi:hypothetical protein